MKRSDLHYEYPESLVAREPRADYRILLHRDGKPQEISPQDLMALPGPNDLWVINDTRVEKRRVFSLEPQVEIVFVEEVKPRTWSVLFPARDFKVGDRIMLPGGVEAELSVKSLPQTLMTSEDLSTQYFETYGEPALPPYIQKARGERHAKKQDELWYQTQWARKWGSVAAPTASLHFTQDDFETLKNRGVGVEPLTLHVGLGTFLPIKVDDLNQHRMHAEQAFLSKSLIDQLNETKSKGGRVWALGTTVTRALEAWAEDHLSKTSEGFSGSTRLFIQPGYKFKVVDVLMTNFHQPESTLLALVAGFAGLNEVMSAYTWAIERNFRLFSYGDFSVWMK